MTGLDLEKDFLEWEPRLWKRVECEDEDFKKLVHSLACKEIALRDRAPHSKNPHREILDKANKQYDEIRSMVSEEKPIVEIIIALISYAVSLDRIERKLNKYHLSRYGKDVVEDELKGPNKADPWTDDDALEEYLQTSEFRTIYCSMVEKFIETPPKKRKLWQAYEIHYFGRKIGAIWPEEVKETLLRVLDGKACDELGKRQKRVKSKADKFFEERRKFNFWQRVHHYVYPRMELGMSKRNALFNFYNQNKDDKYLRALKKPLKDFESFRQAYIREVEQVIKKARKIK